MDICFYGGEGYRGGVRGDRGGTLAMVLVRSLLPPRSLCFLCGGDGGGGGDVMRNVWSLPCTITGEHSNT